MGKTGSRLEGKVACITGAASGIGAACALRFAEEGAAVSGFDLREAEEGDWTSAVQLADQASFQTGDVRSDDQLRGWLADTAKRFGGIDVLVNSAGIAGGGPVHTIEPEAWDQVLDVNLRGTFLACRHAVRAMLERGGGTIINIASVEGIEGFEGGSAYNASKGAVMLLTRNMAIDYGRKNIRVNAVCPGFIETPLFASVLENAAMAEVRENIREASQLGRFGKPMEIANAALFLASDEASFVSGHGLVVDGGYTAGHRVGIARMLGLE